MAKHTYKVAFFTHEVDVAREMISYKGKTVPGQSVTGVGFSFIKVGYAAVGGAIGGIAGSFIANKGLTSGEIIKDVSQIPEKCMGQLVVTYNNEEQKQKVLRVPISTSDQACKAMLLDIANNFKEKFVGFGPQALIEKELNISQKAAYVFVALIISLDH